MAPRSTPRIGSLRTSTRGLVAIRRPSIAFCWLPPLSEAIGSSRAGHLDLGRAGQTSAVDAAAWPVQPGRTAPGALRQDTVTLSITESGAKMPSVLRSRGRKAMSDRAASRARADRARQPVHDACRRAAPEGRRRIQEKPPGRGPPRPPTPTISPAWRLEIEGRSASLQGEVRGSWTPGFGTSGALRSVSAPPRLVSSRDDISSSSDLGQNCAACKRLRRSVRSGAPSRGRRVCSISSIR